jgi:hypothetical protein
LRATDWSRLLIAPATPARPRPWQLWREKHKMPNLRALLLADRFGSASVDARCRRGLDHSRDDDKGHVQRSRRPELCQRSQPMWQPRRARRPRVEIKHGERSRKADTEGPGSEAPANSTLPPWESWGNLPEDSQNLTPTFLQAMVRG